MSKYIEDAIKEQVCKDDLGYMEDKGTYYKCPICGKILVKQPNIRRG